MRNRILNPEFWLDEELSQISPHARLLYQGLWGLCDDNYATFPNRPEWVKAQIFPYEDVDVSELLEELADIEKIKAFSRDGKEYWFVKNFFKYQKIDRPSLAKYPPYSDTLAECSLNTRTEVKLSKDKYIYGQDFEVFWSVYPKKKAKSDALKAWSKLKPAPELLASILKAIDVQKKSPDWLKENGKFIPHPATWLNGRRWEDEIIIKEENAFDNLWKSAK